MNKNTEATKPIMCRKIEPIIIRNSAGWLIQQDCGNCGRGIEKTPTSWRHIN